VNVSGRVRLVEPAIDGYLLDLSEDGARFILIDPLPLHGVLTVAYEFRGTRSVAHSSVRWRRVLPDGVIVGVAFGRF
jgi:hypothetical protein